MAWISWASGKRLVSVCAVVVDAKAIKRGYRASWGYLEDIAKASRTTILSCPVKVAISGLDQRGIRAIAISIKASERMHKG